MVLRPVHYRSARPHFSADVGVGVGVGVGVVGTILSRHNIVLFPYQDLATKVEPSIEPMQIPSGQWWHGSGRVLLTDECLELLAGRSRPDTVLAAGYDVKVYARVPGTRRQEARSAYCGSRLCSPAAGREPGRA